AGKWILASGVRTLVELDSDELRVTRDGVVHRERWSGHPAAKLGEVVDQLLLEADSAFGWVAFEFGTYRFGLNQHIPPKTPLARLFVPRTRIEVTADSAAVLEGSDDDDTVLQRLLSEGVPAVGTTTAVDVRSDDTGYKDRVATAIGEIKAGR